MYSQEEVNEIIEVTVRKVIKELERKNRLKTYKFNSYKRTEQLLYLYPYLEDNNKEKIKITKALKTITSSNYYNVIEFRYFQGMTLEQIAEEYDVKHQTICKWNKKLVKQLSKILFPDEVAKEILCM